MIKQANDEYGLGGSSDFFHFSKSGVYKLRVLSEPVAMATHFFGKGKRPAICYGEGKGCPFHGINPNAPADKDDKYFENPTVKFQTYLLDRSDNKEKLGEIPYSVLSVLADLQKDEDWTFESYPMPYDITVTYDKENKDPKQIYKTIGSPKREAVSTEVENDLLENLKRMPVASYVQTRKEKQMEEHKQTGIWVSDEERERKHKEAMERGMEINRATQGDVPTIEYPTEDINPEDIPF